jgi:hypothetical protein
MSLLSSVSFFFPQSLTSEADSSFFSKKDCGGRAGWPSPALQFSQGVAPSYQPLCFWPSAFESSFFCLPLRRRSPTQVRLSNPHHLKRRRRRILPPITPLTQNLAPRLPPRPRPSPPTAPLAFPTSLNDRLQPGRTTPPPGSRPRRLCATVGPATRKLQSRPG